LLKRQIASTDIVDIVDIVFPASQGIFERKNASKTHVFALISH